MHEVILYGVLLVYSVFYSSIKHKIWSQYYIVKD